ncbi:MAG TPA: methyltransferase domain-containing protein [Candidatus Sulfopaludibacter sp.]|nr:methyltransferase domain-containing protein [Candidatus Sulfopaludibacter sp.]
MDTPNPVMVDRWTGAAPYWEKYRATIRQMLAPVAQGLVDAARIGPGQSVLDIATGPGEPALSIAAVVGPAGSVTGIDLVPGMIAAARRAAERTGLANIRFEVATAAALPFADNSFDAVVCRFGVMFFPSPVDAVREMLRVLKPGGRLALAVWGAEDQNSFFHCLSRVVGKYVEPSPPSPDAPDGFRFARPGDLLEVLVQAGVTEALERLLEFDIQAPISAEEFCALRFEMSEQLREKAAKLPEPQLSELKREAIEALREYATDQGMSFPAQVLIVSGYRP